MVTSAKARIAPGTVPLRPSRKWLQAQLDIGTTTIIELEKAGVLERADVPGVRGARYTHETVSALLGFEPDVPKMLHEK